MGNIRRYYYANKTKIWRGILIVAFILVIIQLINHFHEEKLITNGKLNESEENTINNLINDTSLTTNKSSLGTGLVDTTQLKNDISIIDNFLELCNNKEFNKAYDLLSDECKETLFNTYDIFKSAYCDKIFNGYKTYTSENWAGNTYKIRITEDPLATGNTSKDMAIQEYITIVDEDNGEYKLNINNYICRKEINAENTENNVTIKVINSDIFFDYEIYNIQIKNNTANTIYLDDGEDTSTMYIEDSNNIKYEAASGEVIFSTLKVPAKATINYSIKYNNSYRTNRKISKLVFGKLILNYNEYIKNTNNYKDFVKFEVTF